jgi:hypothetical protein
LRIGPASSSTYPAGSPEIAVDDDERPTSSAAAISKTVRRAAPYPVVPFDLRVSQSGPRELVLWPDQKELLDVVWGLGLHDDPGGPVGRAGVGVDEDRPEVGEVLDEPGLGGADDVADRRGVLEAGDADHDVGATDAGDLVAYGRREGGRGHPGHPTTRRGRASEAVSRGGS